MTVRLLRLKPVAIFWSRVASGSRSPAICSIDELVERQVAVEGGDHPVAPGPHGAGEVVLVAVGVGVAGAVEPVHRHALAVVRRREQPIDELLVGVGRRVGEEGVDLGERRRQAGQVEGHPADQRGAVGLGRRAAVLRLRAGPGRSGRSGSGPSAAFLTPGRVGRTGGSKAQCLPQRRPLVDPARSVSFCAG